MTEVIVESFTMDHTKVNAPFVRRCGTMRTPHGDVIAKYDLRFTQPNKEIMPTGAVHALEHLLAAFLRTELDSIIDISPMGCRTGFYLTCIGEASEEEIAQHLIKSLEQVMKAEEVPAANAVQCGNYRDLSLFGAKEYARDVISGLRRKYSKN
ncbi:MAG: S-ribosylhomocysteine lyase [Firmicutes bacterium]|nr:S-ribosylhomocysteine lyase [Bacillota bacterium]